MVAERRVPTASVELLQAHPVRPYFYTNEFMDLMSTIECLKLYLDYIVICVGLR